MKEILVRNGENAIICEVDGLNMSVRFDDDRWYFNYKLISKESYGLFKEYIHEIYKSCEDKENAFAIINDILQTDAMNEFTTDYQLVSDPRTEDEIQSYLKEAWDKVWFMRSEPCDNVDIEARRIAGIKRILRTYDDIPENGYDTWECGYWNGILGALRWVLGDDKNFLDT